MSQKMAAFVLASMGKCAGGSFTIYLLILPNVPACRTLAIKKWPGYKLEALYTFPNIGSTKAASLTKMRLAAPHVIFYTNHRWGRGS